MENKNNKIEFKAVTIDISGSDYILIPKQLTKHENIGKETVFKITVEW